MGVVNVRLLIAAAAVAVCAVACTPPYEGPAKAPKVAVVGDSITAWSTPEIKASLADYQRSVQGIPSINIVDARERLVQPAVATDPDVLVVELGLNQAIDGWDSSDLPALEGVLKDLDRAQCVVWVIHYPLTPSYYDHVGPGTMFDRTKAFEASLDKRLPKHPNQHKVNFGVEARSHTGWYDDDRMHLSADGKQEYAAFVAAEAVPACL